MDLETALRAKGCRVTRARRVVWDVLSDAGEHLSAPSIADRVRAVDPAINQSSVYRALTVFAEVGLVRESRLEDTATWEPFHGDAAIHLLCERCGTVVHHDTDLVHELRRQITGAAGFEPAGIDVRVTGVCRSCRSGAAPRE